MMIIIVLCNIYTFDGVDQLASCLKICSCFIWGIGRCVFIRDLSFCRISFFIRFSCSLISICHMICFGCGNISTTFLGFICIFHNIKLLFAFILGAKLFSLILFKCFSSGFYFLRLKIRKKIF